MTVGGYVFDGCYGWQVWNVGHLADNTTQNRKPPTFFREGVLVGKETRRTTPMWPTVYGEDQPGASDINSYR